MGSLQAMEMAAATEDGRISLDQALHWHLQSNHYPPVPPEMVAVAKRAIRACESGDYNRRVRLPEGVQHRRYGRLVPAFVVAEYLHLDAFINEGEED